MIIAEYILFCIQHKNINNCCVIYLQAVIKCEKAGALIKESVGRVVSSATDKTNHILCCHGNSNLLELFQFTDDCEALERFRNRQRKFRKKSNRYIEYLLIVFTLLQFIYIL